MESWVNSLSSYLFWDVPREGVDPDRHARWLVERVLQRGRWEDWLIIRKYYDKSQLLDLKPQLRIDPKTAHFLELYVSL
jgi:hypothetical protein